MTPWFDWDENKAAANEKKHDVSFVEAQAVFVDPFAATLYDPDHSGDEDRYITVGLTTQMRLVVVSHTYRRGNGMRLISAQLATAHERQMYEQGRKRAR